MKITLTPELFTELDTIARAVGGCAIEVVPCEEMPDAIGRINPLMGSGYKDSRVTSGVCMTDLSIIQIVNQIDCEQVWSWATSRPELDYSQILAEDMYHFVLWHELAHRSTDLHPWFSQDRSQWTYTEDFWWVNEARADRLAWKAVYPSKRLPRHKDTKFTRAEADKKINAMVARFPRKPFNPRPLPTDRHLMVPATHVRHGIPWASSQL